MTADGAAGLAAATDVAATELAAIVERIRPTVLSAERTLPVSEAFRGVLPLGGIARGSRVSLRGSGAASLCMSLLAEASRTGTWIAVVGVGAWGWAAAARAGWSLERSVFVVEPPIAQWGTVVAALVDAVEIVVVDPTHQVAASDARRLAARSRERGSVIVDVTVDDGRRRYRWPTDSDLTLAVDTATWDGLGAGHGLLGGRELHVTAEGRRGAARPRRITVRFDGDGPVLVDDGTPTATVHRLRSG